MRLPDQFKHSSIKFKMLGFVLLLTLVAFSILFVLISTTYRNGNIQKGYEENQHAIESIGNELLGKKMEINSFMLDLHVDSALKNDLTALADPAITPDEHDRRVRQVVDRLYEYMRKTTDIAMADIHLERARNVMIRAVYSTSVAYSIWEEFNRTYLQRVLDSAGEITVYPSAANRQMVFARAQPMPDGEHAYCIATMLDRQYIMRVLQRNIHKETKLAVLFSGDGVITTPVGLIWSAKTCRSWACAGMRHTGTYCAMGWAATGCVLSLIFLHWTCTSRY